MADTARGEPHEHLARLRLGEIERLDAERLAELLEHGGANLHAARSDEHVVGRRMGYTSM